MQHVLLYITASGKEQARAIAHLLVEKRLVACANILPGVESHYRWQGKQEVSEEVLLTAKTTSDKVQDAMSAVAAIHEYEIPCIVALPIEAGHANYLKWIEEETRG